MASISDRVGDVGEYLREQREHARLSVRQLAHLAGVSNPYLSQVERGLRKPSAEVLQAIARGLRISAEALYVRAGILDDEGRGDVEAAISNDSELNERQRRALLDIYASFRAENRRLREEAQGADDEPAVPVRRRVAASATRASARVRARPAPPAVPDDDASPVPGSAAGSEVPEGSGAEDGVTPAPAPHRGPAAEPTPVEPTPVEPTPVEATPAAPTTTKRATRKRTATKRTATKQAARPAADAGPEPA